MPYTRVEQCRICSNKNLEMVLDLGEQELTGVFPSNPAERLTKGPLRLIKCVPGGDTNSVCGLLQLQHSYSLAEMYGENYGYRSGLNQSMVDHLQSKVQRILASIELDQNDLVIDIGSNDGTTLAAYPSHLKQLVGIDPTGPNFVEYYPDHVRLLPEFFSSDVVSEHFPGQQAKVITSFSMFYDLENPLAFMQQIYDVLAKDGMWVFEQSYLPTMLEQNAYDTACHEHLEYYALHQIKWLAEKVGFSITDLEFNDINGGSFSVTVRKRSAGFDDCEQVSSVLEKERADGINDLNTYVAFSERVIRTKQDLLKLVSNIKARGLKVNVLGASTKGNVLLQYCDLGTTQIDYVGEVNPAKYGRYTPGTLIPIVAETELLQNDPGYLIVLPWHFRDFFVKSPAFRGHKLIFPLPNVEVVDIP